MKPANSKPKTTSKRKHKEETNPAPKLSRMQDAEEIWSEVYATEEYCKTEAGDEIYAKASNNVEMFNYKAPTLRYARRKRKASNGTDQEIEYPPKLDNRPFLLKTLPKNVTTGKYEPQEYELEAGTDIPTYPKDGDGNEYYLKDQDGTDRVLDFDLNGRVQKYARKADGREMYPKTFGGEEFTVYADRTNDAKRYAADQDGNEYYPRRADGDEYIDTKVPSKYALTASGSQFYPKSRMGDELYHMDDGYQEIPAERADRSQFYAKNALGGEIYPKIFLTSPEDLDGYLEHVMRGIKEKMNQPAADEER